MIDQYAYMSKLRYINPALKAIFSMANLLFVICLDHVIVSVGILVIMSLISVGVSGINLKKYLKLCMIPSSFLLIGLVTIAVNYGQVSEGLLVIPFFSGYLSVTESSMIFSIQIFLKSLSAVTCLYFLFVSTPIDHLIGLMDKIKVPKILSEMMLLILRFVFILFEIMRKLSISQQARISNRNFITKLRSSAVLASSVFVRAFMKADLIYQAMESRGYDGTMPYLEEFSKVSSMHMVLLSSYVILVLIAGLFIKGII